MADIYTFEVLKETPEYILKAATLFSEFYPQTPEHRYEERTEDLDCYGLVHDGALVAIGGLNKQNRGVGIVSIDFLIVDEDKRLKGHGSNLLKEMEHRAVKDYGATTIQLFSKPGKDSKRFFKRNKYKKDDFGSTYTRKPRMKVVA